MVLTTHHPPLTTHSFGRRSRAARQTSGDPDSRSLHCDHGYVEYQIPVNPRRINLVMWHSAAATAWLNRWDGGEGWGLDATEIEDGAP